MKQQVIFVRTTHKKDKTWTVRDVDIETLEKIKRYCEDNGITRARYLKEDKRLKVIHTSN